MPMEALQRDGWCWNSLQQFPGKNIQLITAVKQVLIAVNSCLIAIEMPLMAGDSSSGGYSCNHIAD